MQIISKNFAGFENEFRWFVGVVENISDPEKLGRVKVRCMGIHSQNKKDIPTNDLPWAIPIQSITSASTDGIGTSPVGLLPSSIVIGFFLDSEICQHPVIFGSIGGIPRAGSESSVGFNDPTGIFPFLINEPTTNIAARGTSGKYSGKHKATTWRTSNILSGSICGVGWNEPATTSSPQYPYNSVSEYYYKSGENYGHINEFDSTPGSERILLYHHKTKNNFLEIHNNGNEIHKITGEHYELNLDDNTLIVKGDWKIEVTGDKIEHIRGNYKQQVDGWVQKTIGNYRTVNISNSNTYTLGTNFITKANGTISDEAPTIVHKGSSITLQGQVYASRTSICCSTVFMPVVPI